jgi:hypothetical protein
VEREPIVVGGIRLPRESADVEETGGDKDREAAFKASVDNHEGASGLERGARFL